MRFSMLSEALVRVREQFDLLTERDRRALFAGGVLSIIILVGGGLWTLNEKASATRARAAEKANLLSNLPSLLARADRKSRLAAEPTAPESVLIERIGSRLGVQAAVVPVGDGTIRASFVGVPFDTAIEVLADLQAAGVNIGKLRITAAGAGRVDLKLDITPRSS